MAQAVRTTTELVIAQALTVQIATRLTTANVLAVTSLLINADIGRQVIAIAKAWTMWGDYNNLFDRFALMTSITFVACIVMMTLGVF